MVLPQAVLPRKIQRGRDVEAADRIGRDDKAVQQRHCPSVPADDKPVPHIMATVMTTINANLCGGRGALWVHGGFDPLRDYSDVGVIGDPKHVK
jgi:hypothetical protein